MNLRYLFPLVILPLLFYYTKVQIEHLLPQRRRASWTVSILFFTTMIASQFWYRTDPTALQSPYFPPLANWGSMSLGFWTTLILLAFPVDLCNRLFSAYQKWTHTQTHPDKRKFLTYWTKIGILGASGSMATIGFSQVRSGPQVKEVQIPIEGLPQSLQGLRIAQISDLHIGPTIDRDYVEHVVESTLALKPDLIAVTGDLVDGIPEILQSRLEPLARLKAPLGTYFVTGNHEYYWGAETWIETVKHYGFIPLINENRVIQHQGMSLLVAGVTDTSGHGFISSHRSDPTQASLTKEFPVFKLLLAHRPDSCVEAEPQGYHLQLSGHTHGGQFFPWSLLVRLAHRYYQGLHQHGRMQVYVNSGTGYWGAANRFLVPSEITLIRLGWKSNEFEI